MGLADTSHPAAGDAYAAAINGGVCGQCFSVQNSGNPHAPGQGPTGQPTNVIKVQIINNCADCAPVSAEDSLMLT